MIFSKGDACLKIIGITGGIGSGKSTVARILYRLGARIIDADIIARNVVKKGSPALCEIAGEFGTDVLNANGALNRRKLAGLVFGDAQKRDKLNGITHRYIAEEINNKIRRMRANEKNEFVVLDAALPIKKGFLDVSDVIWAVISDSKNRISRVMEKSEMTSDEIIARICAQPSDDEYIKIADSVIENNGTVEELEQKAAKLFMQLKTG
jgi:dephospho-CoA kinase